MRNEMNVPRGTSYNFSVALKYDDGTEYEPDGTEVVRFGIKLTPENDSYDVCIEADYDAESNSYVVALAPEDTANLLMGERYWYDIGLQTENGDYYMVIRAAPFNVLKAVTRKV